jgi:RNA polymerase sigma-70 factor (ECF subfamily)
MDRESINQHLSQISTSWTVLHQAHRGPAEAVVEAQRRLLQRYGAAIYRYLLGALRDPDAADELFQELALRIVRGDFQRADPERGRFRDLLKTALFHLIVDHQRRGRRQPAPLPCEPQSPAPEAVPAQAEAQFLTIWRAELLARAWDALADFERQTGQPLHTVLRFRVDHAEMTSPEMAQHLSARLARTVSSEWVRKRLHFARERFTDYLLEEVAQSLAEPSLEALEQELIDLSLHDRCRSALARWRDRK